MKAAMTEEHRLRRALNDLAENAPPPLLTVDGLVADLRRRAGARHRAIIVVVAMTAALIAVIRWLSRRAGS